jgi:hypothetical protein
MSNEEAATLIFAIPSALIALAVVGLALTKFSAKRTPAETDENID